MYDTATETGAEIDGNIITLHFVDGQRGDDIPLQDGMIIDQGDYRVARMLACRAPQLGKLVGKRWKLRTWFLFSNLKGPLDTPLFVLKSQFQ